MEDNGNNTENEQPIIDLGEIEDLKDRTQEKSKTIQLMGILLGLVLVTIVHNVYSIFIMYTDESIPLVLCPRNFQMDRPVLMKTMASVDDIAVDNWIRGFALTYVRARYPRTYEDVEPMFNYVATRSKGDIQRQFEARMDDIEKIASQIRGGIMVKFWIANSQSSVRIRKAAGTENQWVVSIDGYMHKRDGNKLEKTQPTIDLTIEKGKPILSNPEGLYVTDYTVRYITDPISGETMEL